MAMRLNMILARLEKEVEDQITKNKIKINRFVSKYHNARSCFYTDDENDDLYDFLLDIANEYNVPEEEIYFTFVNCKYTYDGQLSKRFDEDFAIQITLNETIYNN